MDKKGDKLNELYLANRIDEAYELAESIITENPDDADAHFVLGRIFYKKQEWGKAVNQFRRVLEIVPDHKEAQTQLEITNSILNYYTPDMFNP